jgi:hypothetical protein
MTAGLAAAFVVEALLAAAIGVTALPASRISVA